MYICGVFNTLFLKNKPEVHHKFLFLRNTHAELYSYDKICISGKMGFHYHYWVHCTLIRSFLFITDGCYKKVLNFIMASNIMAIEIRNICKSTNAWPVDIFMIGYNLGRHCQDIWGLNYTMLWKDGRKWFTGQWTSIFHYMICIINSY